MIADEKEKVRFAIFITDRARSGSPLRAVARPGLGHAGTFRLYRAKTFETRKSARAFLKQKVRKNPGSLYTILPVGSPADGRPGPRVRPPEVTELFPFAREES